MKRVLSVSLPGASRDLLGELINRLTGRGRESVRTRWCAFRGNEGNDSRFITAREIHGFGAGPGPQKLSSAAIFPSFFTGGRSRGSLMASTRSWRRNSFNSDLPAMRDRSFTARIPFCLVAALLTAIIPRFDTTRPSPSHFFPPKKSNSQFCYIERCRIVVSSFLSFPRIYLICGHMEEKGKGGRRGKYSKIFNITWFISSTMCLDIKYFSILGKSLQ